jgi:hypothetical protein
LQEIQRQAKLYADETMWSPTAMDCLAFEG